MAGLTIGKFAAAEGVGSRAAARVRRLHL